jgi:ribosome-binding protein aMBF1 (putative translation factor)
MKSTVDYLDEAKRRLGLESDYALSKHLDIRQSTISGYRAGRSHFDETIALKIAQACNVDPMEVIASAAYERAKSDEARAILAGLLEKISTGFRWLALPANACGTWVPQV